jgi:hypothetical protein
MPRILSEKKAFTSWGRCDTIIIAQFWKKAIPSRKAEDTLWNNGS